MEKSQAGNNERIRQAVEFYTNQVTVSFSPFDFELRSVIGDSNGNLKAALNLRMSPQSALQLADALQKSVREYEQKVGVIPFPDKQ